MDVTALFVASQVFNCSAWQTLSQSHLAEHLNPHPWMPIDCIFYITSLHNGVPPAHGKPCDQRWLFRESNKAGFQSPKSGSKRNKAGFQGAAAPWRGVGCPHNSPIFPGVGRGRKRVSKSPVHVRARPLHYISFGAYSMVWARHA